MTTDDEARAAYTDDPDPASLAAARIGVEHLTHHDQPLRFDGSTYTAYTTEHRFTCHQPTCPFRLTWRTAREP